MASVVSMKQLLEAEPDLIEKFTLMGNDYKNMIIQCVDIGA